MKQKLIEILRTKEARIQEEKARYSPNPASNFTHLTGNANGNTTFIDAIETIRQLDLGIANPLSFNSLDHQGLERVYFTYLKNGKFVWLNN